MSVKKRPIFMGLLAGVCFAGAASASVINVDFNSYSGTYTGTAAATDTGTYWNGNPGNPANGQFNNLKASDGTTTTTASVTFGDPAYFNAYGPVSVAINTLLNDYFYDRTSSGGGPDHTGLSYTFTLSGLNAGQDYNLYLYGNNIAFTVDGVSQGLSGNVTSADPWVEGKSYALFSNVAADSNGDIAVTWGRNGSATGMYLVNGLQIATVPEPTSASLLLLGLSAALVLRPRGERPQAAR